MSHRQNLSGAGDIGRAADDTDSTGEWKRVGRTDATKVSLQYELVKNMGKRPSF